MKEFFIFSQDEVTRQFHNYNMNIIYKNSFFNVKKVKKQEDFMTAQDCCEAKQQDVVVVGQDRTWQNP